MSERLPVSAALEELATTLGRKLPARASLSDVRHLVGSEAAALDPATQIALVDLIAEGRTVTVTFTLAEADALLGGTASTTLVAAKRKLSVLMSSQRLADLQPRGMKQ